LGWGLGIGLGDGDTWLTDGWCGWQLLNVSISRPISSTTSQSSA